MQKLKYEDVKKEIEENTHCRLLSTEYLGLKHKMKFKCECGNEFENSLQAMRTRKKQYCNECANRRMQFINKKDSNKAIKEIKDKLGNEYDVLGEYYNINTKIKIKHLSCGNEYEQRPSAILHQGAKCPYCSRNVKKTTEKFRQEIEKIFGDEYEVLGEYITAKTPITIRHNKCGNEFKIEPTNFLTHRTCTFCTSRSKGEDRISEYLNKKSIRYEREKRFDNCVGKRRLPFDFYLNDYNILIEYDGIQHFKPSFNEKEFKNIKINDIIKNNFCRDNNIKLIRIPYTEYKNIETILEHAL